MAFISATRLRVRSYLYLPQFVWHSDKSARQAEGPRVSPRHTDAQCKKCILDYHRVE